MKVAVVGGGIGSDPGAEVVAVGSGGYLGGGGVVVSAPEELRVCGCCYNGERESDGESTRYVVFGRDIFDAIG